MRRRNRRCSAGGTLDVATAPEQGTRIRDKFDNLSPEQRTGLLNGYPAGKPGSGDDVAAAVEFLLSESAGFISGVALPVDGAFR